MKTSFNDNGFKFVPAAVAGWLLIASCGTYAQQADLDKGAALFATHCAECHSVKEGRDKKGPSLFAIVGTKSSLREGYSYSEALKASQIVWSPEELSRYIANPKATVPGGRMRYEGLASAADRADLIAYLASQGKH